MPGAEAAPYGRPEHDQRAQIVPQDIRHLICKYLCPLTLGFLCHLEAPSCSSSAETPAATKAAEAATAEPTTTPTSA